MATASKARHGASVGMTIVSAAVLRSLGDVMVITIYPGRHGSPPGSLPGSQRGE